MLSRTHESSEIGQQLPPKSHTFACRRARNIANPLATSQLARSITGAMHSGESMTGRLTTVETADRIR